MMRADQQILGKILGGTYRVVRLIGRGGMGYVFEAVNERIGKRFAVKTLKSEVLGNPGALKRFQREARITNGIGHPNIVEVIDLNKSDEGLTYIIMEYLDGETLRERFRASPILPFSVVHSLTRQVCSALQATHNRGIIHRDLKPDNIFLCRVEGEADFVKIVDFGLSKILDSNTFLTLQNAILGTPSFMAPEQAQGENEHIGPFTDIYALGAILYQAMGGVPCFVEKSLPRLLWRVINEEPIPLWRVRPEVPRSVSDTVARALAKAPSDRFPSMKELFLSLDQAFRDAGLATGHEVISIEEAIPAPASISSDATPAASPSKPTPAIQGAMDPDRPSMDSTLVPDSPDPPAKPETSKILYSTEKKAHRHSLLIMLGIVLFLVLLIYLFLGIR